MKVAVITVQVPFTSGGAEIHAQELKSALIARGCEAELIALPFKWYPPECILDQMLVARLVDLSEVNGEKIDRLITLKFPAYFAPHDNKVAWVLHQYRQAYELYGTPYSDLHLEHSGRALAREIHRWDCELLPQHRALFANSRRVAERMRKYNGLASEALYHPPRNHNRIRCEAYERYIIAPGRVEPLKRQHLMVLAMASLPRNVKLVLIGAASGDYAKQVIRTIREMELEDRVILRGVVSEDEKLDLYARCLAVYYGPYDEDYGYVTLEAFFASKPVITLSDSGGPLEFVTDGETGYVVPPDAERIAQSFRSLLDRPEVAVQIGRTAKASLSEKRLSWDYVIERLLS
jgi:glycosyltransferase involved in cell wall biosynthesis